MAEKRRRSGLPLATSEELRGARAPKQLRSVEALQRIGAAATALLAERDYDDVSIADIAKAAEISVGAFYLRFRSKEHVVAFLMGDVRDTMREQLRRESDAARWTHSSMHDVLAWYLEMMARAFVTHRGVLRPASIIARHTRDPELLALLTDFNAEAHGSLRSLMLARRHLITHPDPERAINMVLLWSSAAIRESVLYGEPVSTLAPTNYGDLTRELTDAAVAYLTSAIRRAT